MKMIKKTQRFLGPLTILECKYKSLILERKKEQAKYSCTHDTGRTHNVRGVPKTLIYSPSIACPQGVACVYVFSLLFSLLQTQKLVTSCSLFNEDNF